MNSVSFNNIKETGREIEREHDKKFFLVLATIEVFF